MDTPLCAVRGGPGAVARSTVRRTVVSLDSTPCASSMKFRCTMDDARWSCLLALFGRARDTLMRSLVGAVTARRKKRSRLSDSILTFVLVGPAVVTVLIPTCYD